tara:strand:- start:546 stop:1181 length:636 start_codon:yes stop_codon:yes gene_type:complete
MCYSKDFSLFTLITGLSSSYLLKKYGDSNFNETNKNISIFFSFVSLMQLVEFLIWSDLDCSNGLNKFAGYIGPLLNTLQPSLLYLLHKKSFDKSKYSKLLNYSYLIYVFFYYINYLNNSDKCSKLVNKHISWDWSDSNWDFYMIIIIFNSYLLFTNKYNKLVVILSAIFLLISKQYFRKNIGEFWCLFVTIIPTIILLTQKIEYIRKKHYS